MLARYFIFCVIALLMLLDCSRDETIFDNGWSAANDNCTAIPSVTVPLGRSCFILVWCSVGTLHQRFCVLSALGVGLLLEWNIVERVVGVGFF
jgi:hypothetical protein